MKKLNAKNILKYTLLIYIAYLIYSLPKKDWEKGEIIEKKDENGKKSRYAPKQSSYIDYIGAWWSQTLKTKGLSGIIDEYVLGPLGMNKEEE